jgi:hypothetical protein
MSGGGRGILFASGVVAAVLAFARAALADTGADELASIERRQSEAETLLEQCQFEPARRIAERLFAEHPDLPAAQWLAGWVKFHFSEAPAALALMERAAAALGPGFSDPRLTLVRATARATRGFVTARSPDGRVIVRHAPGVDRVLVPDLIECVERTLEVVGRDLGHSASTPILVEILPDRRSLADCTGLALSEIESSGTIAVSKYNRLMVTSPRSTLTGYSWADTVSHELVHRIISERTFNRTPIWLHEALARFEDSRWRADEPLYRAGLHPADESLLAKALREDRLIPFERMHPSMAFLPTPEAAQLAFAEVYTVAQFLIERGGYPGVRRMLDELGRGRSDWQALQAAFALDAQSFPAAWMAWLRQKPRVELEGAGAVDDAAASQPERRLQEGPLAVRDFFHLGRLLDARQRPRGGGGGWAPAPAPGRRPPPPPPPPPRPPPPPGRGGGGPAAPRRGGGPPPPRRGGAAGARAKPRARSPPGRGAADAGGNPAGVGSLPGLAPPARGRAPQSAPPRRGPGALPGQPGAAPGG